MFRGFKSLYNHISHRIYLLLSVARITIVYLTKHYSRFFTTTPDQPIKQTTNQTINMHFSHFLVIATAALSSATAIANPEAEAYNQLTELQGKLDSAILLGRGLLNNPYAEHDGPAKRAADYLSAAFDAAEQKRDLTIAAPQLERRGLPRTNWCHFVGQGCGKVRRSAEAVKGILGDAELQKRLAEPGLPRTNWCHFVGQGCGKVKRSIDTLLKASEEVLAAYPQ